MKNKEKKLTMSLLAALAVNPSLSTAEGPQAILETTQIVKDGVSISVKNEAIQAALMISIGKEAVLSEDAYKSGVEVLDSVDTLRKESVEKPVELQGKSQLSKQLIQQLIESNKADFNPSSVKAAVIFTQYK